MVGYLEITILDLVSYYKIDLNIEISMLRRLEHIMVSTTVDIEFQVDAQLKSEYEKACTELGLTTNEAFTMFATKVAVEKSIPFEITVDPFFCEQNRTRLKKSIDQMEAAREYLRVGVPGSGVDKEDAYF
jgi:DNA-damage-inducible protein J